MLTADNLFLVGGDVPDAEAPQSILDEYRPETIYHAVLEKTEGYITADDFVRYGQRFILLCDSVYQGSELELRTNNEIPVGIAVASADLSEYLVGIGDVVEIGGLS